MIHHYTTTSWSRSVCQLRYNNTRPKGRLDFLHLCSCIVFIVRFVLRTVHLPSVYRWVCVAFCSYFLVMDEHKQRQMCLLALHSVYRCAQTCSLCNDLRFNTMVIKGDVRLGQATIKQKCKNTILNQSLTQLKPAKLVLNICC